MRYKISNFCKLCQSKKLRAILKLSPTPWADDFRKKNKLNLPQPLVPLNINLCLNCKHGQLSHIMEAQDIYLNYTYETSSSPTLKKHFKDASEKILKKFKPTKNRLIVDIGSNDGMLLNYFKKKGMKVLGVDPMPGIASIANKKGINTLNKFFNKKTSEKILNSYGKASIITANNVIANIDNLNEFIKNVKRLMNQNSLFIFETFWFYLQIKNFVWDFTYHEHCSYFTVLSLKKYFASQGMEIIDVEKINSKGGSMRCAVQLKNGVRKKNFSVEKFIQIEKKFGFPKQKLFLNYSKRIKKSKKNFLKQIRNLLKKRKKISAYGASATSTTLMYHYEMDFLDSIYDDFIVKQNTFSPGYKIPVLNPNEIYKDKPDYIIILAWRYKDQIIKQHKSYIDSGGMFIVPLPKFEIIKKIHN